ncbi:MAG TPA: hypothetical protein VHI71_10710 [Actinomycetota bacterium]|nr:hypothetical protein [Actinomycetota bacterium]
MTTRFGRFAALLCAAVLLAGACSDGGEEQAAENPEQAFSDALEALGDYEGVTIEMTVEGDAASLAAQDMTEEEAQKLLDSSLTLSTKGGTPEDAQAEIAVNVAGNEDAVELRVVEQSLYARVEVRDLVEEFGGNAAEIDATVQQATAQGFDFAQPLVDGEWIGVENINELAEQFGGGQLPTPDPEEAQAVADEIARIFEQNASVTSEGSDDVGAHLVVSVPLRETLSESLDALQGLSGAPAGAIPGDALQEVPDASIPVDAWISDGQLVQVEFDFVKIAEALDEPQPEGVEDLAIRATLDEFTEDVEAPSDFTAINLQEILQSFFGGLGTM